MDEIKEAIAVFRTKYGTLRQHEVEARQNLASADATVRQAQADQEVLSQAHATYLRSHGFPLVATTRQNDWPGYSVVYSLDNQFLAALHTIEQLDKDTRFFTETGEQLKPPPDVHVVWFGVYSPSEIAAFNKQRHLLDTDKCSG